MNNFSKFINTDVKENSPRNKIIVFCLIMFPIIAFSCWFAVQTFIRGSENPNDLTHISGVIISDRIMKHKHEGKYKTYYEDVLVISIQGCGDEFGFMEFNKCYSALKNLLKNNNQLVADIYYDKSRNRIEENVTLHTFDLKINGERFLKIEDIKKSEFTGSLFFALITIILIWITYLGIKKIKQKGVIL